jgi:YVTN family beta-propeller protein
MKKSIYIILLAAALMWSCSDEKFIDNVPKDWTFIASINGESALKLYKMPEGTVSSQDYYNEINGETLPGHVTKIVKESKDIFLLIPDAFKIYVVDLDFKKKAIIDFTDLQLEPTEFCLGNFETAFIAHAKDNKVSEVDLSVYQITQQIEVGKNPISIAGSGNQIYTANHDDNTVSVIDTRDTPSRGVTHTLDVNTAPNFVGVPEGEAKLLVITYGDTTAANESSAKSYLYETVIPPELIYEKDFGEKYNEYLRPKSTALNLNDEAQIVSQQLILNLNTIKGKSLIVKEKAEYERVSFCKERLEMYYYDAQFNVVGFTADRTFKQTFTININNVDFIYPN